MGDVTTLVIMPAVSSHWKPPKEARLKLGIEDFEIIKEEFGTAPGSAAALKIKKQRGTDLFVDPCSRLSAGQFVVNRIQPLDKQFSDRIG